MIRLRQSRYLLNPDLGNQSSASEFGYKWEVPISFITCNDLKTVNQRWLRTGDDHIELTFPSGNTFLPIYGLVTFKPILCLLSLFWPRQLS